LPMYGLGFDRDWGIGASRDFAWGDAVLSATTGSGMPLYMNGNYLISARVSRGVLNQENYNAGLYISAGEIPDIAGYQILDGIPKPYTAVGTDFTRLWDRFEFRLDGRIGEKDSNQMYALLGRATINMLEENRMKLEFQPVFTRSSGVNDYFLASGLAYSFTSDLTMRGMFEYQNSNADKRLVTQLYYYFKI
jgi:hypothetical protein